MGINIDDCAGQTCSNNGKCIDGNSSFNCECDYGYVGEDCSIWVILVIILVIPGSMLVLIVPVFVFWYRKRSKTMPYTVHNEGGDDRETKGDEGIESKDNKQPDEVLDEGNERTSVNIPTDPSCNEVTSTYVANKDGKQPYGEYDEANGIAASPETKQERVYTFRQSSSSSNTSNKSTHIDIDLKEKEANGNAASSESEEEEE